MQDSHYNMIEAATEYAVGMLTILCRLLCRYLQVGWHWDGDDYLSLIMVGLWTVCSAQFKDQVISVS